MKWIRTAAVDTAEISTRGYGGYESEYGKYPRKPAESRHFLNRWIRWIFCRANKRAGGYGGYTPLRVYPHIQPQVVRVGDDAMT